MISFRIFFQLQQNQLYTLSSFCRFYLHFDFYVFIPFALKSSKEKTIFKTGQNSKIHNSQITNKWFFPNHQSILIQPYKNRFYLTKTHISHCISCRITFNSTQGTTYFLQQGTPTPFTGILFLLFAFSCRLLPKNIM